MSKRLIKPEFEFENGDRLPEIIFYSGEILMVMNFVHAGMWTMLETH
jgi:hypothetical protein